jgi:hypothetical protein
MTIFSKLRNYTLLAFLVFIFCASSAFAIGHEKNHQHGNHVSPFVKKIGIHQRCALMEHNGNHFCPHRLKVSGKTIPFVIGSDCGSYPFQKKSASSGSNLQYLNDYLLQMSHYESSQTNYSDSSILFLTSNYFFDPPPKLA